MNLWIKVVLWIAAIAGALFAVLYAFFYDFWTVPADDPLLTAAIEPTLHPGDLLIVTRRTTVDRGNLLRCPDPQAPGRYVIARAMARWGDLLDLSNENVSIDGHTTPSPRACEPAEVTVHNPATDQDEVLYCSVEEYGEMSYHALRAHSNPEPFHKLAIEPAKWFLVSDDRHVHLDSRDFGQIESGAASGCQHIVFRVVGAGGFFDSKSRLSIIW
jgi:signal peptidase I